MPHIEPSGMQALRSATRRLASIKHGLLLICSTSAFGVGSMGQRRKDFGHWVSGCLLQHISPSELGAVVSDVGSSGIGRWLQAPGSKAPGLQVAWSQAPGCRAPGCTGCGGLRLQGCRLQGRRLQGSRAPGLQAAGLQDSRLQGSRLQGFRLQAQGCQAAGLQAAGF